MSEHDAEQPIKEPTQSTAKDIAAIELILRKTRQAYGTPGVAEGFLWFFATIGAVTLSTLFLAILAPNFSTWITWVWFGGTCATILVGMLIAFRAWKWRPDNYATARLLQSTLPELRDDIVSALQFGADLQSGKASYSEEMARGHIHATSRNLLAMCNGQNSIAHLLPARDFRPSGLAALSAWALIAILAWWSPPGLQTLMASAQEHTTTDGVKRRPIIGELDVQLTFPAYTRRAAELHNFVAGHINAPVGTEIRLRTYPILPNVERFEIVLTTEDGVRQIPVSSDGGLLVAKFLATKAGTYRFQAHLNDGQLIEDAAERTIRLTPDEPPTITITLPQEEEVEVSPEDVVEIEYFVVDDYGIEAVYRTNVLGGADPAEAKRIPLDLPELTGAPKQIEGKFSLDLKTLDLRPKDVVVVRIHATDNNSLTGPSTAGSRELVLRVASPEDRHLRLLDQQTAIMDALVNLLADYLEAPVGERIVDRNDNYRQKVGESDMERAEALLGTHKKINQTLQEIVDGMVEVSRAMESDPLTLERDRLIFESLQIQLGDLRSSAETLLDERVLSEMPRLQLVANHASDVEDTLEKGILRLDHLLMKQKQDMVKAAADEIRDLKDRLRELLESYRDTQDPELKEAIKREIQRLRQRMNELMQRMQSQMKELPKEHVNMEAMESEQMESDVTKISDAMQNIEDLLESGDIDGALAALDQMEDGLDSLTSEMDENFGQSGESDPAFDKHMSELMDRVHDLESLQKQIEEETSEAQKAALEETAKKMEKVADEVAKRLTEEVKAQKKALDTLSQRKLSPNERLEAEQGAKRLGGLEKALDARDFEQASELARRSAQDLKGLEFSMQLSERYTQPGSPERRDLQKSLKDMESMNARGQRIERELESLMQEARQQMAEAGSGQMEGLQEKQEAASQQADKLGEKLGEAASEYPSLDGQLRPSLDAARKAMGESGQSLERQQTQRSIDHQKQALEELDQLKQSMKQAMQQQRQKGEGGRDVSRETVVIPEEDQQKGKDYREEVMRNMREDRLQNYADEIQRYYESLME